MNSDNYTIASPPPRVTLLFRVSTWILIVLVIGFVYVSNAWSPSSYANALNWIGAENKPDFGSARRIRSDEWAVQTPLTQALVNNQFSRYNSTSIYNEDLRILYGLPILDWGLIFKPSCWGYFLLPAPYAFSLYYYFLFSIFVIGYALLFRRMGMNTLEAILIAFSLYFSGAIQFWWTSNAATFSYFPWVLLLACKAKTKPLMAIPLFWILVCWQLGNFYPPFIYGLCLVGIAWLWILKGIPSGWKSIVAVGFAACLAAVVVLFYLWDYLQAMSGTSYPGIRNLQGGTAASWYLLPSHFFPSLLFGSDYHLINEARGGNICESGTWATLIPLMMLFFCKGDIKGLFQFIRMNWIPFLVISLMMAWFLLPIPANIARFIGLNQVHPNRLMVSFGLVINMVLIEYGKHLSWHITYKRISLFWGFLLAHLAIYKMSWPDIRSDTIAILFAASLMLICFRARRPARETVLLGVALFGLVRFAPFNPIQDAKPIFSPPHVGLYNTFSTHMKEHGYINFVGPGAVINGLGFPSIAHVNTTPQLNFWNAKFPALDPTQRNLIFNRYAHIQVSGEELIRIGGPDLIFVPRRCFMVPNDAASPCLDANIDN
jgi:hypothetical protein